MAQGGDLFALSGGIPSEPNFDIAVRGYKRDQVDGYIQSLESDIAALAAEREDAYTQVQALAAQVHQLQQELHEQRMRGTVGTVVASSQVSFRHLGPRVEQILALAEEQAEAIKADAVTSVRDQRVEADRILADAHNQ